MEACFKAWNDRLLEKAPSDRRANETRIALLQQQGEIESALAIAEILSSQGFADYGRNSRFLDLCIFNHDRECAIEHLENLARFLADFEQRLGQTMPGIGAVLDYFSGRLRHPDEAAGRESLEKAASAFSRFTVLSSGSVDIDSRRYFLAEILTLQGKKDAAVAELHRTLELADGGFVATAPGNVRPEHSTVLAELRDQAGYDDWLVEFTSRRTAMRKKMIEMEAAGELARTP